jgi:hypothetical protein
MGRDRCGTGLQFRLALGGRAGHPAQEIGDGRLLDPVN